MRRVLRWIAGLLTLPAALAIYLWRSTPPEDRAPHPFNQDRNAVWLEHRWLERAHPVDEMDALFESLHRRGVLYAFPHLIPFDAAGRLPRHSREQMRTLLESARRMAPGMRILPWVGGLRAGYRRTRPGSLDLADLGQRGRLAAECRGLMDEGFDGVHLNVEPVDDGNVEFLALLRAVRTAVGDNGLLSVSTIRPGPMSIPGAPNFFWTLDYYRRVASVVDQVAIMSYDTGLPTAGLYRRYVSYAASSVTRALAQSGTRARVLLGVPTYDETGLMHRASVENPGNALLGVIAGLRGVGGGGTFEGVALYAEWTTDEHEWRTYERLWRGQGAEKDGPLASNGAR